MNADSHPASWPTDALLAQCELRTQRRSGPGGQHRNKVETGVFLRHRVTELVAQATERRSQGKNRDLALFRLRLKLATDFRMPAKDVPSELWLGRLRGGRVECSAEHDDFPAVLADALDQLAAQNWDHRLAAERLSITPTQLLKLLRKHAPALSLLNAHRAAQGRSALS